MSAEAEMNAELGITELAHWTSWWPTMMMTNPISPKPEIGPFFTSRNPLVSIKTRFKFDSYQKLKTINEFWNCVGGFVLVGGF